jgi:hypothetical protein
MSFDFSGGITWTEFLHSVTIAANKYRSDFARPTALALIRLCSAQINSASVSTQAKNLQQCFCDSGELDLGGLS